MRTRLTIILLLERRFQNQSIYGDPPERRLFKLLKLLQLSTFDEEKRQDEEDKEAEDSDLRVQTPFHFESTDDEAYNEVTQGDNVEEEKLDEEKANKEEEVNELYNDVNINLEGRDIEITDALLANVQATQVIEDNHVIMTIVTPEVQKQSSSVSSCFISNMRNPTPDA
nr:hypothetical protein [Tanacetum cinerariifolium]